jgi:hypothetical protein
VETEARSTCVLAVSLSGVDLCGAAPAQAPRPPG